MATEILSGKDNNEEVNDNDLLLRKRKSIRRKLLGSENVNFLEKHIAILGGSTTIDFKNMLEIFLLKDGIKPIFYESEYNKFYEDAVFSNPELEKFHPDIIIIYTSIVNIIRWPMIYDDEKTVLRIVDEEFGRYEQIWKSLRYTYPYATVIQNNMDVDYQRPMGSLEAVLPQGRERFLSTLNEKFAEYACSNENFYLHDMRGLSMQIGVKHWHNRFQYHAYKFAVDYNVVPDVARGVANIIKGIVGKNKKCLVLDLDNTLWGGVIGDDGVEGIQIGHETPVGEAYADFQEYVKRLQERGVILAVCSKNEESIAKSGFSHPDSVLKLEDFAAFRANWEPKDVNIASIANELSIGTDSMVFLDDNPVERQLVRDAIPEVIVPEIDSSDVSSYITSLEFLGCFEPISVSADDLKRNDSYRENKGRMELQSSAKSYDEFLESLDMVAEIAPWEPVYYDRIAQLTNKTNQFNLTTKRMTLAELKQLSHDGKHFTLYGRLRDKFGDNGLVSVVLCEKRGDEYHIILWLMSCRVLKRGMEQKMMDVLVSHAKQSGVEKLVGYYYRSSKNAMVKDFYKSFGFSKVHEDGEDTVWELPLSDYELQGKYINLENC